MGRWRYSSNALTLALVGGWWSVSHLGRFTARKVAPTTRQMEEEWALEPFRITASAFIRLPTVNWR